MEPALTTVLTAADLIRRLDAVAADAPLYVYGGGDGLTIQAEPPLGDVVTVLRAPTAVPIFGGPCI